MVEGEGVHGQYITPDKKISEVSEKVRTLDLRVSLMIYLLKHSSATCSGFRPVPQVVQRNIRITCYPNSFHRPKSRQFYPVVTPSHLFVAHFRPRTKAEVVPVSALYPSPYTEPRACCKALAYRQSDGTMLLLHLHSQVSIYSNNNDNTDRFNGFNIPTATIPNDVPALNQDDVAVTQLQPTGHMCTYAGCVKYFKDKGDVICHMRTLTQLPSHHCHYPLYLRNVLGNRRSLRGLSQARTWSSSLLGFCLSAPLLRELDQPCSCRKASGFPEKERTTAGGAKFGIFGRPWENGQYVRDYHFHSPSRKTVA